MEKKSQKGLFVSKGVDQPSSLNPKAIKKYKHKKAREIDVDQFMNGIIKGDRTILSRAITLIESHLDDDQHLAQQILERCLPYSGNSIRIGITGVPGVGKSTFIESLGTHLISKGKKLAVLAVDPSSERTKGSILGDKTRMLQLSSEPNAFIRPSPSSGTLGGVAQKTRESIILCEAAGFDTILVETVGVGQSETAVHSMVDLFMMLVLAGAGDELQGIKRGIMELVDLIVINKADDQTPERIKLTQHTYLNALHLLPLSESKWQPKVEYCSSVTRTGVENIWKVIQEYKAHTTANKYFEKRRKEQSIYWLHDTINRNLMNSFFNHPEIKSSMEEIQKLVLENKMSPFVAAETLMKMHRKK